MNLEYRIDLEDYVSYNVYNNMDYMEKNRNSLRNYKFFLVILGLISLFTVVYLLNQDLLTWLFIIALFVAVAIIMLPRQLKNKIRKISIESAQVGNVFIGEQRVTIDNEQITVANDLQNEIYNLSQIENISILENVVLLHLGRLEAIIIPRKHLSDEQEKELLSYFPDIEPKVSKNF